MTDTTRGTRFDAAMKNRLKWGAITKEEANKEAKEARTNNVTTEVCVITMMIIISWNAMNPREIH